MYSTCMYSHAYECSKNICNVQRSEKCQCCNSGWIEETPSRSSLNSEPKSKRNKAGGRAGDAGNFLWRAAVQYWAGRERRAHSERQTVTVLTASERTHSWITRFSRRSSSTHARLGAPSPSPLTMHDPHLTSDLYTMYTSQCHSLLWSLASEDYRNLTGTEIFSEFCFRKTLLSMRHAARYSHQQQSVSWQENYCTNKTNIISTCTTDVNVRTRTCAPWEVRNAEHC